MINQSNNAQEVGGTYSINELTLDCEFINKSNENIFIIGLNKSIQDVKFYSSDGEIIPAIKNADTYPFLKATREWTYLRNAGADYVDPGSRYRLMIPKANLPDPKDLDKIDHLVIEIKIRSIKDERIIGEEKIIEVKLEAK